MIEEQSDLSCGEFAGVFVGMGFVGIDDARICMRDKSNQ